MEKFEPYLVAPSEIADQFIELRRVMRHVAENSGRELECVDDLPSTYRASEDGLFVAFGYPGVTFAYAVRGRRATEARGEVYFLYDSQGTVLQTGQIHSPKPDPLIEFIAKGPPEHGKPERN